MENQSDIVTELKGRIEPYRQRINQLEESLENKEQDATILKLAYKQLMMEKARLEKAKGPSKGTRGPRRRK